MRCVEERNLYSFFHLVVFRISRMIESNRGKNESKASTERKILFYQPVYNVSFLYLSNDLSQLLYITSFGNNKMK